MSFNPDQVVDLNKFAARLKTRRGTKGLRAAADEIGEISSSTLSRIEQGNVPDLETFIRLCRWLNASPEEFYVLGHKEGPKKGDTVPEKIEAHLRADRTLPPATIDALAEMIRVAYQAASAGKIK